MTIQRCFPWNDPDDGKDIEPMQLPKTLGDVIYRMNKVIDDGAVVGVVHGDYNKPGQGIKHDVGKPKFHLLPFDLMDGEQRVWEKGAVKYAPNQWRKGMPTTQAANAAMRHLTAYMMGEDIDPETGESHLDHLICCVRMMENTRRNRPELDDRIKVGE
jgi:hypothetical protein